MSAPSTPVKTDAPTRAIIKNVDSEYGLITCSSRGPGWAVSWPFCAKAETAICMQCDAPVLTPVTDEMQHKVIELAATALQKFDVERDVAMWLKKEADRLWGVTWHCIVGKK